MISKQRRYADQAMGRFIELAISGPGERILRDSGASENQAMYGAFLIGMMNPVGGALRGVESLATKETAKIADLLATHGRTKSNKGMDKLIKELRKDGIQSPFTVTEHQGKLYVLDGNNRLLAAPRAGISEVPVNRVELPFGAYKSPADLIYTPGGF